MAAVSLRSRAWPGASGSAAAPAKPAVAAKPAAPAAAKAAAPAHLPGYSSDRNAYFGDPDFANNLGTADSGACGINRYRSDGGSYRRPYNARGLHAHASACRTDHAAPGSARRHLPWQQRTGFAPGRANSW